MIHGRGREKRKKAYSSALMELVGSLSTQHAPFVKYEVLITYDNKINNLIIKWLDAIKKKKNLSAVKGILIADKPNSPKKGT